MNTQESIAGLLDKLIIFDGYFVAEIKDRMQSLSEEELKELSEALQQAMKFQNDYLERNPQILQNADQKLRTAIKSSLFEKFKAEDAAALQNILRKIQSL